MAEGPARAKSLIGISLDMRAKVAEIAMKTTREMTVMTRSIGIAVVLAGLAAPASAQSDQGTRLAGACQARGGRFAAVTAEEPLAPLLTDRLRRQGWFA